MAQQQNITAIIYDKRGNVLSVGKNSYIKTHPLQKKHSLALGDDHKFFLHAEIHAITRCRDLTRAHRIVVTRVLADGSYGLAAPCKICQSALREAGIRNIEHT